MKPTKKVEDRIKNGLAKFKKVLQIAKDRDLNESDTVAIINDMLADVFGYEKYTEITSELMIRGTYCDLAIRINDKFEDGFLIECKRIGTELKDEHMRQAVNYGVNKGIKWVILTNGIVWKVYKLRFEQPVSWDLVLKLDLMEVDLKNETDIEKIYCICKEGILKNAREELYEKVQCVNRFVIGQLIIQEPVLSIIRRELRKMSDGIAVEEDEIANIITSGIFRRDIIDEEQAEVQSASVRVAKFYKQSVKRAVKKEVEPKNEAPADEPKSQLSVTEQLLAEAEKAEEAPAPAVPTVEA